MKLARRMLGGQEMGLVSKCMDRLLGRTAARRQLDQDLRAALAQLEGLKRNIRSIPPPPEPADRVSVMDVIDVRDRRTVPET